MWLKGTCGQICINIQLERTKSCVMYSMSLEIKRGKNKHPKKHRNDTNNLDVSDIYSTVKGVFTTALTFCPITEKNAYLSHCPCIDYSSPEATSCSRIGMESLQNCKALLNFACESIRLWDSFSIALIIYCPESWSSLHYSNSSEEVLYCTGNVFWSFHWNQLQWQCECVFHILYTYLHHFSVFLMAHEVWNLLGHKWTFHDDELQDFQESSVTRKWPPL